MAKYKGSKGHGNGYHGARVWKNKNMNSFMDRVQDAMQDDRDKAKANNMILVVDNDIEQIGIYQMCIFCYNIEMEKVKENYFKCSKCGFIKKKRGVEL